MRSAAQLHMQTCTTTNSSSISTCWVQHVASKCSTQPDIQLTETHNHVCLRHATSLVAQYKQPHSLAVAATQACISSSPSAHGCMPARVLTLVAYTRALSSISICSVRLMMAQGVQAAQQQQVHQTAQQEGGEQYSTWTSPHCQKIWKMMSSLSCGQQPHQQLQSKLDTLPACCAGLHLCSAHMQEDCSGSLRLPCKQGCSARIGRLRPPSCAGFCLSSS